MTAELIEINLLPERYRKKARKKVDINLPLIVGGVLLILFLVYIFIEAQARLRKSKIDRLTAELEEIEPSYLEAKAAQKPVFSRTV